MGLANVTYTSDTPSCAHCAYVLEIVRLVYAPQTRENESIVAFFYSANGPHIFRYYPDGQNCLVRKVWEAPHVIVGDVSLRLKKIVRQCTTKACETTHDLTYHCTLPVTANLNTTQTTGILRFKLDIAKRLAANDTRSDFLKYIALAGCGRSGALTRA